MDALKMFVEFVGTSLSFMLIYFTYIRYPNYTALAAGLAFFITIEVFSSISANLNPVATLIFVLANEQPKSDLVTLVIPQLLAGWAVIETFKYI